MHKILRSFNTANGMVCPCAVLRVADGAFIPLDPANTDYQQFLSDIASGAPLQDADGNTMTPEAVAAFIESLGA